MTKIFALSCIAAVAFSALSAAEEAQPTKILTDEKNDVSISYVQTPTEVVFIGNMPTNKYVYVLIDGNQDGEWGYGPALNSENLSHTSSDFSYVQGDDGQICAQYVLAEYPQKRNIASVFSYCGVLQSKATVETGTPDKFLRVDRTIRIPNDEIFGSQQEAHIAFLLLDGHSVQQYFAPKAPFVLRRQIAQSP